MVSQTSSRLRGRRPTSTARWTLTARRTKSTVKASGHASSKSLTPQIRRPSISRQVPKFSTWRSPTARTLGAAVRSGQTSGQSCAQRFVGERFVAEKLVAEKLRATRQDSRSARRRCLHYLAASAQQLSAVEAAFL